MCIKKFRRALDRSDFLFLLLNSILSFSLLSLSESQGFVIIFALFIVMQFTFTLFYIKKSKISIFSIAGFFIVLTYIFHFGQVFVHVIDPAYQFRLADVIGNDYGNSIKALLLCFSIIPFVVYGLSIASKFHQSSLFVPLEKQKYLLMAIIIILISFPIKLYVDINKILLFFRGGYELSYVFRLNGIITQFANFYFVGFVLLILVYKDNKRISSIITLFLLLYQCITMLTGNRGIQLISIVVVIYIYYKFVRRFNKYDFIALVFIGIIGVKFISVMSILRSETSLDFSTLVSALLSFDSAPFLNLLEEFGYTLQTIVLEFRIDFDYAKGMTYILSFFTIFPNIGDMLNDINYNACFVNALNYPRIGGSYLGELFYNFGIFSHIFAVALGYFVAKISFKLEDSITNNKLTSVSYLLLPSISILWWVRNYFKDMPREFVWGLVFFNLLSITIDYILKKRLKYGFNKNTAEEKLVSIIMSVYNTDVMLLDEAVKSVLMQSYSNFEFIIVNDNSDNLETLEYLGKLSGINKITVINNSQNLGLTKSLNIAISYAQGEYIARMDSDDVCSLDRLMYQVDFLNKHQDIDVLGGSAVQLGVEKNKLRYSKKQEELKAALLFRNNYIIHPTVMLRRNVLQKFGGYDERFPKAQDYALWCKLINKCNIMVDDRIVLNYRIHDKQATNQFAQLQKECARQIRNEYSMYDNYHSKLLDKLANAKLEDISNLNGLTDYIIGTNALDNKYNYKYLEQELSKYYCYQAIKIMAINKNILLFKRLKYRKWFLKLSNIQYILNQSFNRFLRKKYKK